ncbi:DNA polymerase IV [Chitinophaga sp. MM2321]|uniref:DNA polymerase IV n=1 Tax=Chitinophaga sp. MM2321 TaxID=3137178 RepID=UPI0032D593F1
MEGNRNIVHLDLDSFFVSVERLKNSKLHGMPLIVGGGERGVVAACSYEARKFGVHSAMPIRQAKYLCPQAIIISGDYDEYSKYSTLVTDIIRDRVPLLEKASIDEFYADLSGMDRFFNLPSFIVELKNEIVKHSGLPISYALATNKLVGKIATNEVKPNGQITIAPGQERAYVAPLNTRKMPGIGEKTNLVLYKMGIRTFEVLAQMPENMLVARFGKAGGALSLRARGIDASEVIPYSEQKSISTENTFQADTMNMEFLHITIVNMVEKIGFELRKQEKLTGCIAVKIRYSDFNTVSKQRKIHYTNADHLLIATAKELFQQLYEKRVMIRLLGIKFTDLVQGTHQIDLFTDTATDIQLYQAIDYLKKKYGAGAVMRASGI